MTEYIIKVDEDTEQWRYVQQQCTHFLGCQLVDEIVRCKDCVKWHHIDTDDGVRYGECGEWKRVDSIFLPATREDGFCAWGKRRADG